MYKNSLIQENSFYDVNQRRYSEEELQLIHDLTGMPLFHNYQELMDSLEGERKDVKTLKKSSREIRRSLVKE